MTTTKQASSVLDFFLKNVSEHPNKTAALIKTNGTYGGVTWQTMGDDAKKVAAGLLGLGVKANEHVCIMANTRYEWCSTDMGILWSGGVTVPIYPSSLADDVSYIVDDAAAVVAFVEDDVQAQKFRTEKSKMPSMRKVIQMTGAVKDDAGGWIISFDDFVKQGKLDDAELSSRQKTLTKDSILTIIYTSGTTGRPKGVVLTHDAMLYEAEAVVNVDILTPEDVQLFFLPLAHVFAKVLEVTWLATRHVMAFAENMQTIRQNLGETKPTVMCAVPRVFEKFYGAVVEKGTAPGGLKAKLFKKALALSSKKGELEMQRGSLGLRETVQFEVLKKLVFSKVGAGLNELLGGRMRLMVSGGAPLSPKINFFFRDAGLLILEGYGLTETSAASFVNRPEKNRIGTVGLPLPGTESKIAEDGEILIRGRGVMREYWKKPEATAEVLEKDGWFHTGDIGVFDKDGCLRITDRKKDIIVTAGGKNVAPQNIENLVKTNKLISQIVVHGDKRKYLTALITLDPDTVKAAAAQKGLPDTDYAMLVKRPEVRSMVEEIISESNKKLASYESIKKFEILDKDFSVETGELTPKLSVKRKVVSQNYKALLDRMYDESPA